MTFGFSWLVYSNTFTGGLESALSFMLLVILIWKGLSYRYSKNKSAKSPDHRWYYFRIDSIKQVG